MTIKQSINYQQNHYPILPSINHESNRFDSSPINEYNCIYSSEEACRSNETRVHRRLSTSNVSSLARIARWNACSKRVEANTDAARSNNARFLITRRVGKGSTTLLAPEIRTTRTDRTGRSHAEESKRTGEEGAR